jgi:capsular exopolysaccharide synthesis family protein
MQNNNHSTDVIASASAPLPSSTFTCYAGDYGEGAHLRDYWYVLKRRKWWALGVAGGVLLITILLILLMTPVWEGSAILQITQDNGTSILSSGSKMDPIGQIMGSSELDRFYQTQYTILHSATIAYALMDALKLQDHPSYKKMTKKYPKDPPGIIRQKYAKDLLEHLFVLPIRNSYLVNVVFRSTDKALAQKVPEVIQREYLKLCMNTRQQSFAMLRDWLDGELVRQGRKLEISEQNAIADGQKGDFLGVDMSDEKTAQLNVVLQKYVQLGSLLTKAQSEKAAKEALYKQISEKGADAPVITDNLLIQKLREQLIGIQGQASGTGQVFGAKFPDQKVAMANAKQVQDKLDHEVKRLAISVKSDYEAALKAEKLLQQEYDNAKAKMIDMENGLVNFHMLKRDLQTNQALYEGLLARMKDASVAASMVPSNVSVITASEPPYEPYMPRAGRYLAIAMVLGTLMGIGVAFLIEYLDNSIKTVEELEKVSHIPSLGMIPLAENGALPAGFGSVETITHFQPRSQISEAISHIRSAIMLSTSTCPPQVIVVTSCNPSEGKTTTTSNIAIGLSGSERKVLLIDCDMRKPRLHTVFKESNRRGLTNYLTGNAALEEIIRPTEVPNLYFMPAGPTPPNPNDLIASEGFSKMIDGLRQEFRHIIIDSPPVIGFADARMLSVRSDGVVLAFRHNSTTREAARLAVQMLVHSNSQILGGILTMVKKDRLGHGAYSDYYNHYQKYYKSYNDSTEEQRTKRAIPRD